MNYSSFTPAQKKILATMVVGTFGGTAMLIGCQIFFSNRYLNMPYTKKALNLLQEYPTASEKYIGTEIKPGRLKLLHGRDSFNKINQDDTRLSFLVYGDKGIGKVFLWARRKYDFEDFYLQDEWLIRRLDLEVYANNNKKRWKFYETEPVPDIEIPADQEKSLQTTTSEQKKSNTGKVDNKDPMIWVKANMK